MKKQGIEFERAGMTFRPTPKEPPASRNWILEKILTDVAIEYAFAVEENGPFNSAHEGYAVILEELDELKAWVWTKKSNRDVAQMRHEAIQVAAMAVRFVSDLCDSPKVLQDHDLKITNR